MESRGGASGRGAGLSWRLGIRDGCVAMYIDTRVCVYIVCGFELVAVLCICIVYLAEPRDRCVCM